MVTPPSRDDLKVGLAVEIETEGDQGTSRLTSGAIAEILTPGERHPYGIKVILRDGQVGWVKKVAGPATEEQARPPTDLDAKPIPKTVDKHNEFKEFYQYDPRIEYLANAGAADRQKAIWGMMRSVRERFAAAACTFGNDSSEGFVHPGIRADGTVAGLERDKKVDNFAYYDYSFTNHIRGTPEAFLWDRVFIRRNIQMWFRRADGKTVCTVQILPAERPLYLHTAKGQASYVRGPAPRVEAHLPTGAVHIQQVEILLLRVSVDG